MYVYTHLKLQEFVNSSRIHENSSVNLAQNRSRNLYTWCKLLNRLLYPTYLSSHVIPLRGNYPTRIRFLDNQQDRSRFDTFHPRSFGRTRFARNKKKQDDQLYNEGEREKIWRWNMSHGGLPRSSRYRIERSRFRRFLAISMDFPVSIHDSRILRLVSRASPLQC